jgi:hypothetical protein
VNAPTPVRNRLIAPRVLWRIRRAIDGSRTDVPNLRCGDLSYPILSIFQPTCKKLASLLRSTLRIDAAASVVRGSL